MNFDMNSIVMVATLLVFNVANIKLLSFTLARLDLSNALSEKSAESTPQNQPAGFAVGAPSTTEAPTSYSRVAGFIGAVVLATFFWALGNVILFKAFTAISEVRDLVSSLSGYFLAGASMFLPYAVNQLRSAFTSST